MERELYKQQGFFFPISILTSTQSDKFAADYLSFQKGFVNGNKKRTNQNAVPRSYSNEPTRTQPDLTKCCRGPTWAKPLDVGFEFFLEFPQRSGPCYMASGWSLLGN